MIVELIRLLYEMERAGIATPADRRAKLKALYIEAKPIAAKLGEVDKTQVEIDAAVLLAADSPLWSDEVNAAALPGKMPTAADVDAVHAACPDAARKGRWTAAQVRALFGLA